MTNEIKKYCEGLDCAICDEKEPCIYKIANELQEQLSAKEQECEDLKKEVGDLLNKPEIQDKILWKIDNKELLLSKDTWIYKLEQTLAEIKEIVGIGLVDGLQPEEYSGFLKILQAQILQKISECEANQ